MNLSQAVFNTLKWCECLGALALCEFQLMDVILLIAISYTVTVWSVEMENVEWVLY